jgi:hypothetical protein
MIACGVRRLAVVRDYLVCEADFPRKGGWIGDRPDDTNPAGRELAEFIRASLREHVTRLSELWNEEGFGWSFNCAWDAVTVNVRVQRLDHWLVICSVISLLPQLLRPRRYKIALSGMCYYLDRVLRSNPRFRNVRWLTRAEFELAESSRNRA